MYLGVSLVILGQGFLFGSRDTLVYGVLMWVGFAIFVHAYEEPTLRRTFGAEYDEFCANVPRWIPRLTPWVRPHSSRGDRGS
jgi:protein-S-isoprenylcysteine O-methyltransferase Ste14